MESILFLGLLLFLSAEISCKTVVTDCGKPDSSISFNETRIKPDPIKYPGNVSVTTAVIVTKDLPASGLQMSLSLDKLDPKRMHVPCLKDIGSCNYDACSMIQSHPNQFCPMFPPGVKCGCPIKAGRYELKNAGTPLPDFGEIFAKILQGNYDGNITFVDTSNNKELGCLKMSFQIVANA